MNASKLLSPEPQDAKVTLSLLQTSILKLKNLEKSIKTHWQALPILFYLFKSPKAFQKPIPNHS